MYYGAIKQQTRTKPISGYFCNGFTDRNRKETPEAGRIKTGVMKYLLVVSGASETWGPSGHKWVDADITALASKLGAQQTWSWPHGSYRVQHSLGQPLEHGSNEAPEPRPHGAERGQGRCCRGSAPVQHRGMSVSRWKGRGKGRDLSHLGQGWFQDKP